MSQSRGIVYLVGAGPGDPGLLTRRGADVIAVADVVVYDHLASARLLELAPSGALLICAGKSSGHCILNQDQINALLIEHGLAGRIVVRLKGGDPLVFGRGAEEAELLARHGIRYEIIPGVTAGVGVTAYAGIPVTHRGVSSAVAFVTGHADPSDPTAENARKNGGIDWHALSQFPGTLVVYMGVTHLGAICNALMEAGKSGETPATVIESGTLPCQRVVEGTLDSIAHKAQAETIQPPALLVVGNVAGKRSVLGWYESQPLFGKRIVITRPLSEARKCAPALEAMGAEVLLAPMVEILPPLDYRPIDDAIDRLNLYNWLIFTSANGVRSFIDHLFERGNDLRMFGNLQLGVIGPGTAAALESYHLRPDLVPDTYRSEALAEALAGRARGSRILLARADRGRTILKEELDRCAQVDQIAVYRNKDVESLPPDVERRLATGQVDWVTLTSPAIASRFFSLLPDSGRARIGKDVGLASLSPVTSETIRQFGYNPTVEPASATWDHLVQAIVAEASDRANRG